MLVLGISKYALSRSGHTIQSNLQIFVTATKTSGIRIITFVDQNIMDSRIIEYPIDKSYEYIQGVIEQELSDRFIALKTYMHHHQVKPSVVMFLTKELHQLLLGNSKFDVADWVSIDTSSGKFLTDDSLMDLSLACCLNFTKLTDGAANKEIRAFFRTMKFNNILFKPVWLGFAFVFAMIAINDINTRKNKLVALEEQKEYQSISNVYRTFKDKYPGIKDLDEIIDYQSANMEIQKHEYMPFDFLYKFLDSIPRDLDINSIYWSRSGNESAFVNNLGFDKSSEARDIHGSDEKGLENGLIIIRAKYITPVTKEGSALLALENDMLSLVKGSPEVKMEYYPDHNDITVRSSGTYIPVKIVIKELK
jgi:hypothetical protein